MFNASLIAGSAVTLLPIVTLSSLNFPVLFCVGNDIPRTSIESKYSKWYPSTDSFAYASCTSAISTSPFLTAANAASGSKNKLVILSKYGSFP